jgi:hypothetical protein
LNVKINTMKKVLTKILGSEFMELSGLHKFYAIYCLISLVAVCSVLLTDLWCLILVVNFIISACLASKIKFNDNLNK